MFPRRKRISRTLFPSALRNGRRISSEYFTAVIPEKTSGYAVVVPKKIARLSVARHRMKRQVIGALQSFPLLPKSLIIFPKPSAFRLDSLHLRSDLAALLGRAMSK
ncbi:ribonuclease P protein component [Patescibacteria group bacterium]|nr:ribonuclease P protein component [Patescibacteria group bacterium]